jgi:hypothetical protein
MLKEIGSLDLGHVLGGGAILCVNMYKYFTVSSLSYITSIQLDWNIDFGTFFKC